MKQIPLTRNMVALVDDVDYEYISQWKWMFDGYARRNGKRVGHITIRYIEPRHITMHRSILERKLGRPLSEGEYCDHVNGNKLDNRRSNLRIATHQENIHNRPQNINNTSGYKGVKWHNQKRKWRAQINVNGRRISLGMYHDIKDAARAYNDAAKKYHGEFAYQNPITDQQAT